MVSGNSKKESKMLELIAHKELKFSFPEIHQDAKCAIKFMRTLRIPDDNRQYPLPPGFGSFPIEHVEDHASRLPKDWSKHGGVMLPVYQAEALWLRFISDRYNSCPMAIKIAAGKINAISGKVWTDELSNDPQDYLVIPEQPWLDGFCVGEGFVRQFVSMPLELGYTAEEQLTGEAEFGGMQIIVYPMKRDHYDLLRRRREEDRRIAEEEDVAYCMGSSAMGIAPGGLMKQKIYADPYGIEAWEQSVSSRCFVHLLNSNQWLAATGKPAPDTPITAQAYTEEGLPWFDYYAEGLSALKGSETLAGLSSVAAKSIQLEGTPLEGNEAVVPKLIHKLEFRYNTIKDGNW
jgi:hypothetical protein